MSTQMDHHKSAVCNGGVTKYDTFIEERFKSGSKSLSETIPVFSKPGVDKPKGAGKLPGLTFQDCILPVRLEKVT